jgi:hypothetical protein
MNRLPGQVYKGRDGIRIGTMVISKRLDAEWSHPVEVEEARVYRSWKSKRRGDGKKKMVSELLLPKPGGHVLSP